MNKDELLIYMLENFNNAKDAFINFIGECQQFGNKMNGDYHVLFSNGTVVRLTPDVISYYDINNFNNFFDDWEHDFPVHRIRNKNVVGDYKKFLTSKINEQTKLFDEKIIKVAYHTLISSGYPLPGGSMADSYIMPLPIKSTKSIIDAVVFPEANKYVFSISYKLGDLAHMYGRDARRYDYMFPYIDSIINPDGSIINISLGIINQLR